MSTISRSLDSEYDRAMESWYAWIIVVEWFCGLMPARQYLQAYSAYEHHYLRHGV